MIPGEEWIILFFSNDDRLIRDLHIAWFRIDGFKKLEWLFLKLVMNLYMDKYMCIHTHTNEYMHIYQQEEINVYWLLSWYGK